MRSHQLLGSPPLLGDDPGCRWGHAPRHWVRSHHHVVDWSGRKILVSCPVLSFHGAASEAPAGDSTSANQKRFLSCTVLYFSPVS